MERDSGGCSPRLQSLTQLAITHSAKGNVDEGNVDEGNVDEGNVDEGEVDEGEVDEGEVDEGETELQCALQGGNATQPMQAEPTRAVSLRLRPGGSTYPLPGSSGPGIE